MGRRLDASLTGGATGNLKEDEFQAISIRRPTGNPEVAVVGPTTLDINRIGGKRFLKMGGVTTYAGLTYVRFGIPTHVITNLGADELWMMERLRREGIRTHFRMEGDTAVFVNIMNGEKRSQQVPSQAHPIRHEQTGSVLEKVHTVHIGPLIPEDIDPEVIAFLGKKTQLVALDIQGYVRRLRKGGIRPMVSKHLSRALHAAHIIKGDRDEIDLTLDHFGYEMGHLLEAFDIREAVVTEGEKGGVVYLREGAVFGYRGFPVSSPVDPTGSGDVFFAAYITRRWLRGSDINEATRVAAQTAARQVAGKFIAPDILLPEIPEKYDRCP